MGIKMLDNLAYYKQNKFQQMIINSLIQVGPNNSQNNNQSRNQSVAIAIKKRIKASHQVEATGEETEIEIEEIN